MTRTFINQNSSYDDLNARYNSIGLESIRSILDGVYIVKPMNKGLGTIHGYYPLTDSDTERMKERPRNLSLTFNLTNTSENPIDDLTYKASVKYLVKNPSRFFLKPDVGEILDQIDLDRLADVRAIAFIGDSYDLVSDTDGEHFIMIADLLI